MVVQLSVIEAYGIIVFRAERNRGTEAGARSSKLYVFRLSKVEEYLFDLNDYHRNVDRVLSCSQYFHDNDVSITFDIKYYRVMIESIF